MTTEESLRFATLSDWRAWQWRQQPKVRRIWLHAKRNVTTTAPSALSMVRWNAGATRAVVVAIDGNRPTFNAATLRPAQALIRRGVDVIMLGDPGGFPAEVGPLIACDPESLPPACSTAASTLSVGDHMPMGAVVQELAQRAGIPHFVVQHGILTPLSPPSPSSSVLLVWSEKDGSFWRAGRSDTTVVVVGSQLLWEAQQAPLRLPSASQGQGVVFLGQLHGAEMPRRSTLQTVASLRAAGPVQYRPHPGEADILSRIQHRVWVGRGVDVASHLGLSGIDRPVLGHFSTGLLESAAMGMEAYAYCARPPRWLKSLWNRYELATWGDSSTATTVPPIQQEPAEMIADVIIENL